MKLGDWDVKTISGGRFRTDGGTMFGVVPKVLWTRKIIPDELNRIPQYNNCVLIRTGETNILIDTGYGSKLTAKQRKLHAAEEGFPLVDALARHDVSPEQIDAVVLSHLHFDHAGGLTKISDDGSLVPVFPKAEVIVQRGEWETAVSGWRELKGVYSRDNLDPIADSGRLRLIDGDVEMLPGIHSRVTGGHTEFHQAIVIEEGGTTAVYAGDACPTSWHLPLAWTTGYDLFQLQTRRAKLQLLSEIAENNWWLLFDHDPESAAARISPDDKHDFVVREKLTSL